MLVVLSLFHSFNHAVSTR